MTKRPAHAARSRPRRPRASTGRALFAFSARVRLAPHASVTLRYAYGAAHARGDPGARARATAPPATPLAASEAAWRAWLPADPASAAAAPGSRASSSGTPTRCARAPPTRSAAGRHIISQGGYYQYDLGFQGAFRDPLQHMLPMVYADPALARDVLLYSAQEQPRAGGQIPYAMSRAVHGADAGDSDDLDLWLLLAASEYGLATRDLRLFDQAVPYSARRPRDAVGPPQARLPPPGVAARPARRLPRRARRATGPTSPRASSQMTESTLVTAQAAYIYPRLARAGRRPRRPRLRGRAAPAAERDLRRPRGRSGRRAVGTRAATPARSSSARGAIFGEPQPWAILAGAPDASQAATLVANIRRYLGGVGATAGPSRIGSAQSPAADDPSVSEHGRPEHRRAGRQRGGLPRRQLVRRRRLAHLGARQPGRHRAARARRTRSPSSSWARSRRTRRRTPRTGTGSRQSTTPATPSTPPPLPTAAPG